MIRYPDNWTPAEHVSGASAAGRFDDSQNHADTIEVTCRYTGGQSVRAIWGRSDGTPFIYLYDSGRPDYFASDADAEQIYQALLSELVIRQSFVNSDPRSPDHFSPDRDLDTVADEVNGKFGTNIEDVW